MSICWNQRDVLSLAGTGKRSSFYKVATCVVVQIVLKSRKFVTIMTVSRDVECLSRFSCLLFTIFLMITVKQQFLKCPLLNVQFVLRKTKVLKIFQISMTKGLHIFPSCNILPLKL